MVEGDTASAAESPSFRRDRVTWLAYTQFALYGYFLYSFTPAVDLLRTDEHLTRAIAALHGTAMAVGGVLVGVLAPWLINRFGRRIVLWAALGTMCLGVALLTGLPLLPLTLGGAVLGGFGGVLLGNVSTAILSAHHPGSRGAAAITEGTGIGSGVGLLAPLLLGAAIALRLGWRSGMLLLVVFAGAAALVFATSTEPPEPLALTTGARGPRPRMPRAFWWACGVLVLTTSIEFSLTIWTSDVLHGHIGVSRAAATAGVTVLIVGMTVGRLTTSPLTLRYSADLLLVAAFLLTLVGFGIFWTAHTAVVAYVGLLVTGFGIALHYPLAISRIVRASGGHPDLATSYASLGGGAAIGLAPFALGAVADHVGSHTAMLLVPVFAALGITLVPASSTTPRPQLGRPSPPAPRTEIASFPPASRTAGDGGP
ncbi:MAG: MFS transporter [Acidothermus sp.]|nr:MFS transporter [Acidothermus sp.]MCL6538578.1 MFS transporter [Acidothermus sp.]